MKLKDNEEQDSVRSDPDGDNKKRVKSKASESKRKKPRGDPKPKLKQHTKVNVDRQCGVPLINNDGSLTGLLCSRSLTCKTHTMGAKRGVRGRSKPYDVLLVDYQRRNNLKASGIYQTASKRLSVKDQIQIDEEEENKVDPPLPPAQELAAMIAGSRCSLPIPLASARITPVRLRNEQINLKELLFKTTSVPPPPPEIQGSSLSSIMAQTESVLGRCVLYNPVTESVNVRPSLIYGNTAMNNAVKARNSEANANKE